MDEKPRYTLWGKPNGKTDGISETLLLSEATAEQCDKGIHLATQDGWHSFRRTLIDNTLPDFAGTVTL